MVVVLAVLVATQVTLASGPLPSPVAADVPGGLGYVPVAPCRVADTRVPSTPLTPGSAGVFRVRGNNSLATQGGSATGCGVPVDAAAAEVTITAIDPAANGFLRAFGAGSTPPTATFLNYSTGRSATNTGTVPLVATGNDGELGVLVFGVVVHVVVDVQGYFVPVTGRGYVPLPTPCRVVDTRNAVGVFTPGATREYQVAGSGANFAAQGGTSGGCQVPPGIGAFEVSVTALTTTGKGFLRLTPNDGTNPNSVFVNYSLGASTTNTGSVTASTLVTKGLVARNFGADTHLLIDVQGFYPGSGGTRYQTVTPCRIVDTRNAGGAFPAGTHRSYQVGGAYGGLRDQGVSTPAGCGVPQRAAAVEASLTAVDPVTDGFARAYPTGRPLPNATILNFSALRSTTNTGTIPLAPSGSDDLVVSVLGGSSAVIVDVFGYYEPPAAATVGAEAVETYNGHTCAVLSNLTLRCWGSNGSGQLGTGNNTSTTSPVVAGPVGARQVAVGGGHTCAVTNLGALSCWGRNHRGQLGVGSTNNSNVALPVTLPEPVDQVVTGEYHTCALLASGSIRCWGLNSAGQLGDGSTADRLAPVAGPALSGVVQLSAGDKHTCAVLSSGAIRCWGENNQGQLGDGTTTDRPSGVTVSGLVAYLSVDAGGSSTCAVVRTGGVRCWGRNDDGQLGSGTFTSSLVPVAVQSLTDVLRVGVGGLAYPDDPNPSIDYPGHACALVLGGGVRCWGSGQFGELSTSEQLPVPPSSIPQISLQENELLPNQAPEATTGLSSLTVGYGGACSSSAGTSPGGGGLVRCWGVNGSGQAGSGAFGTVPVATAVPGIPF
jgi:hypothetical protein